MSRVLPPLLPNSWHASDGRALTAADIGIPEQFNLCEYLLDRHVRAGQGARAAVVSADGETSYTALLDQTCTVAASLLASDVRMGERVLLLLPTSLEYIVHFLAALRIGAVPVLMDPLASPEVYGLVIQESRARVVVIGDSYRPILRNVADGVRGSSQYLAVGVADESPQSSAGPDWVADTNRDDEAFWIYTSGSTGWPKACVHLHHDLAFCAELYGRNLLGIGPADRILSIPRLHFSYGLACGLALPLAAGASTVLWSGSMSPTNVLGLIDTYSPTVLFGVPLNYSELLTKHPNGGKPKETRSLRMCVSAGEALPAALVTRFQDRFGVDLVDGIGSTEAPQAFISNRPGQVRPGSAGRTVPGFEALILRDDGSPADVDETGHLFVRAESALSAYWHDYERSASTILGEWLRTGDMFRRDADGFYWYAGRSDDMLKIHGEWVSPTEIEAFLQTHPSVQSAAIVARSDEHQLPAVMAYVVGNPNVDSRLLVRELSEAAQSKLPEHKRPRWIEVVGELPRTGTGKIQRFKLK